MLDTNLEIAPAANAPSALPQNTSALFTRKAIADAVASVIPEGKHVALVAVASTDGGFHTAFAAKLGDHWEVAANFDAHVGHASGSVKVLASW